MRRLIYIFINFCLAVSAFAVPARPGKRTMLQPDGTTIEYYVYGDEIYHYMADSNGRLLERKDDGGLLVFGETFTDDMRQKMRAALFARRESARRIGGRNLPARGLVILVNFSDLEFDEQNTREAFDDMLNGDNYTYNGATGSVKQYFSDQSAGAFVPIFDVYGPVTLSKNKKYYGENDRYGNDAHVGEMVRDACKLAYEQFDIDLSQYDADGDGYVDFVDILYAGYGEADSDDFNAVWPCEWELSSSDVGRALSVGGKIINTFSCHQEKDGYGTMKGKRAGIGTPCHEFAHVFGLPDMYDTNYKNVTLGNWDLMDGGAYNNDSRTPPGFSGYERLWAGWANPRLINSPENITLNELQDSQEILIVSTTGEHNLSATTPSPSTFYILENRQQTGWDTYLPGHGMLVWRIIYNQYSWIRNAVNTAARDKQGVVIIPADGSIASETSVGNVFTYGDAGDSYPGRKNIRTFSNINNYPITDIEEKSGVISFKFMGGEAEEPPLVCKIGWDLENVTVSPYITEVNYGETLVVDLIPEIGYDISEDDMLMTMGDSDLYVGTDYTYINHQLSIPDIKGDMYIIVLAHEDGDATSINTMTRIADNSFSDNATIHIFSSNGLLLANLRGNDSFSFPGGMYIIQVIDDNKKKEYKICIP